MFAIKTMLLFSSDLRFRYIFNSSKANSKGTSEKAVTTTTTYKNVQQEDGTYKKIPETTVASILVSNPLTEQVKMNNLNLSRLRKQQDEFVQKKLEWKITCVENC